LIVVWKIKKIFNAPMQNYQALNCVEMLLPKMS